MCAMAEYPLEHVVRQCGLRMLLMEKEVGMPNGVPKSILNPLEDVACSVRKLEKENKALKERVSKLTYQLYEMTKQFPPDDLSSNACY